MSALDGNSLAKKGLAGPALALSGIASFYIMLILGVIAYFLRKLHFPLAPIILGFVLGESMEENLRRALAMSGGDPSILFHSGIAIGLWICAVLVLLLPLLMHWLARRAQVKEPVFEGEE